MASRIGLMLIAAASLSAAEQGAGKQVYAQRCGACHGTDGAGKTPMGRSFKLRDLASPEVQKQTDEQLYDVIAKGRNGRMPAFRESLGEEKIRNVIAYLRSMSNK